MRLGDEARALLAKGLNSVATERVTPEMVEESFRVRFGIMGHTKPVWSKELDAFLQHPEASPVHLARLLYLLHGLALVNPHWLQMGRGAVKALNLYRNHHELSLADWQEALSSLGADPDLMMITIVNGAGHYLKWGTQAVWPYFEDRQQALEAMLLDKTRDERLMGYKLDIILRLLDLAPQLPEELAQALLVRAFKNKKSEARGLWASLVKLPDLVSRLSQSLSSSKSAQRAKAAQWLAELKASSEIDALESALAKEKNGKAKVALQEALGKLGRVASAPLSPKRKLPQSLGWLKLDATELVTQLSIGSELKRLEPWPELIELAPKLKPELGLELLRQWLEYHQSHKPGQGSLGVLAAVAAVSGSQASLPIWDALESWGQSQTGASLQLLRLLEKLADPVAVFTLFRSWLKSDNLELEEQARSSLTRLAGQGTALELVDRSLPRDRLPRQVCQLFEQRLQAGHQLAHSWDLDLWRELCGHPLVGELCRERIWQSGELTFRINSEGNTLDAQGRVLEPETRPISLAHTATVSEVQRLSWGEQSQFPSLEPEGRHDKTRLFLAGQVCEKTLWQRAQELGYRRYQPDDRRYYHFLKRCVPLADYDIYIEFPEGVARPEGDRQTKLAAVLFAAVKKSELKLRKLSDVPVTMRRQALTEARSLVR